MKKIALIATILILSVGMIFAGGGSEKATDGDTLVYWSMWNETEAQGKVIKEAAKAYEKKTGTKIEIHWKGRDVNTLAQPALEAGENIDIFDGYDTDIVTRYAKNGLVIPLDDYITEVYDTTDGKTYAEVTDAKLFDIIRKLSIAGHDGKLYGVPTQGNVRMVFYNMEAFEDAGITKTPTTWDEYLAACEKLLAAGYTPTTVDDAYYDWLFVQHIARIVGADATVKIFTDEDWDNPAVLQMAQDYEDLVARGYMSQYAGSNKFPAGQQELALGEAAMYFNGSWLPNEIFPTTGPDFQWGGFPYPGVEGGIGVNTETNFGAVYFTVTSLSKQPDKAFDFITFLTSGEYDEKLATDTRGIPVGNDAEWPPMLANVKEAFAGITGLEVINVTNTGAVAKMKTQFGLLLGGEITAEEFVKAMK